MKTVLKGAFLFFVLSVSLWNCQNSTQFELTSDKVEGQKIDKASILSASPSEKLAIWTDHINSSIKQLHLSSEKISLIRAFQSAYFTPDLFSNTHLRNDTRLLYSIKNLATRLSEKEFTIIFLGIVNSNADEVGPCLSCLSKTMELIDMSINPKLNLRGSTDPEHPHFPPTNSCDCNWYCGYVFDCADVLCGESSSGCGFLGMYGCEDGCIP